jgi:hypothetical protein
MTNSVGTIFRGAEQINPLMAKHLASGNVAHE